MEGIKSVFSVAIFHPYLHNSRIDHAGILVCSFDPNFSGQTHRIHTAIESKARLRRNSSAL